MTPEICQDGGQDGPKRSLEKKKIKFKATNTVIVVMESCLNGPERDDLWDTDSEWMIIIR